MALLLAVIAPQDAPPLSSASCFDGRCITHSYPRDYIMFFKDGVGNPDADGLTMLREFAAQHRWWPHLGPRVCLAAGDPSGRTRTRLIRRELARAGYRNPIWQREGVDCAINGGSRRAPGLTAYQFRL